MKNRLGILCLSLLLLCGSRAFAADTAPSYGFEGRYGSTFEAYIQADNDLIVDGTGFDTGDVDFQVENSVARVTPEGKIEWIYHFPYVSEVGGSMLYQLSDGRYVKAQNVSEYENALYFFDAESGYTCHTGPIDSGWFYPVGGHILAADRSLVTSIRIRWLDLMGKEEKVLEYDFGEPISDPVIMEASDGYILLSVPYADENAFILTKIGEDGTVAWQNRYASSLGYVNYAQADGQDGAYLLCDPGLYHDSGSIMRVNGEGVLLWEREVAFNDAIYCGGTLCGDDYLLLMETDTSLQAVYFDPEGKETREPARVKPDAAHADATYEFSGMVFDHDANAYVYGYERAADYSEVYGHFFLPLKMFPQQ